MPGAPVIVPAPIDGFDNKDTHVPTVAVAKKVVPVKSVCPSPVSTVTLPPDVSVVDADVISLITPPVLACWNKRMVAVWLGDSLEFHETVNVRCPF